MSACYIHIYLSYVFIYLRKYFQHDVNKEKAPYFKFRKFWYEKVHKSH